jgi:hypothetical protein
MSLLLTLFLSSPDMSLLLTLFLSSPDMSLLLTLFLSFPKHGPRAFSDCVEVENRRARRKQLHKIAKTTFECRFLKYVGEKIYIFVEEILYLNQGLAMHNFLHVHIKLKKVEIHLTALNSAELQTINKNNFKM